MERENKKRGREEGEEKSEQICNAKKQQEWSNADEFESFRLCSNELGVFDFPWLKEGVIFKGSDECFGLELDTLAPSSYLSETPTTSTADADQLLVQNVCQQPATLPMFRDEKFEDDLWSFQFDELEALDFNWSSVFDQQPPDIALKNKVLRQ